MVNRNTYVEINGKRYDARTGKIIESVPIARAGGPAQSQTPITTPRMDGFVRQQRAAAPVKASTASTTPSAKPARPSVQRKPAPAAVHSRHQKSKTLMRHAVKNPALKPKLSAVQAPMDIQKQQPGVQAPAVPKAAHSTQVQRSALISRFGTPSVPHTVVKRTEHVPVKPAPATAHHHKTTKHFATPASASTDLFADALKKANSHEEPTVKEIKKERVHHKAAKKIGLGRQAANFITVMLIVFTLGGFVAYQNAANLSMRVAAAKAGINGTLPKYQPAGFSIGDIAAQPGIITVSFNSNSDSRSYDVSQRVSNWNSETLLSNYIDIGNRSYQTFQDKGKTIFIYDGSKAAWVNGGVMYEIIGDSTLSSDQLLKIASSL